MSVPLAYAAWWRTEGHAAECSVSVQLGGEYLTVKIDEDQALNMALNLLEFVRAARK